jgi:hypothetical protein
MAAATDAFKEAIGPGIGKRATCRHARKTGLLTLEKRGRFWFYRADRPALDAVIESLRLLEGDDGT